MSGTAFIYPLFLELAILLDGRKAEILSHWRSISMERPTPAAEKFVAISGSGNVYSENLAMINEAKEETLALVANLGLIQMHLADKLNFVSPMENRNIQMRSVQLSLGNIANSPVENHRIYSVVVYNDR